MIKIKLKKLFISLIFAFFFCNLNVWAVNQFTVNDLTYVYYFNMHNLQFSQNELNQKYYNFIKDYNFDFKQILIDNDFENRIDYNNWFISFNGNLETTNNNFTYDRISANINEYDLTDGIRFRVYFNDDLTQTEFKNQSNVKWLGDHFHLIFQI